MAKYKPNHLIYLISNQCPLRRSRNQDFKLINTTSDSEWNNDMNQCPYGTWKSSTATLILATSSHQRERIETTSLSLSHNYLSRPVAALTHVERQGESRGIKDRQWRSRAGPAADLLKVKLKRNGGTRREGMWRPILQWKLHGACHGGSVPSINPSTHTWSPYSK